MGSEEVYIMQETEDEWVKPTPVWVAIRDTVTSVTDLEPDDLENLESYVDTTALQRVLGGEGDEKLQVRIEGHDVTVHANGDIHVD